VCLSGAGSANLAPISRVTALLARHVDEVAHAFRTGGGVPYAAFRPEFTDVMDEVSRGLFVMLDATAASSLEDNLGNPLAPWLYGVSTLHCLTVSLAEGGAGLGTVWGEQLAMRMLAEAGFVDVTVHDVPDDPLDSLYVARTRARRRPTDPAPSRR
jgi:hypothetical protein